VLGSLITLAAGFLLAAAGEGQVAEIPQEQRIPARVLRTLDTPPGQKMHMPTDVAVDGLGRVFVADGANDRIVRFTTDGGFDGFITGTSRGLQPAQSSPARSSPAHSSPAQLPASRQAGAEDPEAGPADESLSQPIGVGVDSENRLWVTDTGRHRLVVFSADGKEVQRISLPAFEKGRLANPTDVAVSADGKRAYVVDNDNHRILVRDNAGGSITSLGQWGNALGEFRWPFLICLDSQQYVYVSEAIGARVQRISPADRWAGQISRYGVELGTVYRPKGVAADHAGRIFVSDSTLGVVQVFAPLGRFIGVLTDASGKPLRFQHPMGMCFGASNRLYLVELKADRVAVLAVGGPATASAPAAPAAIGGVR
jgi:DNA-binding beta-propeller fold protein YncE